MNIRARILLLVAASFLALLTVGALAMYQARKSEREVRFVTETVVPSAIKSVALLTKLKEVHIAALGMVSAPDEATIRQAYEETAHRRDALSKAVDELDAQSDSKAQRGLVELVRESQKNYFQSLDDTAKLALAGQRDVAQANMAATVDQYLREQGEALGTLDIEKNRSKDEAIRKLNERLSATLVMLAMVTLAALAFLGVIGFVLYRRIVAPIGDMQASMTRIATTQDFSHRVQVERDDEIGKSLQAFNLMIEKIEESAAQVRRKTADIHAMLDNIPQGILAIESGGRIHPEVSQHLAIVLERTDVAGQLAMEVLFADTDLGADALSQVDAAIAACIGEDAMNFEFNAHLLPAEIEKTMADGRVKILDLNWSPMMNEQDQVDRLLVCVRDVTDLRALARAAQSQRRELGMIGEILGVHQEKFQAFCADATTLLDESCDVVEHAEGAPPSERVDAINVLFRNVHTVKGNARTHGLLQLADAGHEVEEHFDRLRAGLEDWDASSLNVRLAGLRQVLHEYRHLSETKLGRHGPGRRGDVEKFALIPREQVRSWQRLLESMGDTAAGANLAQSPAWQRLRASMARVGTETLGEQLAPVLDSLPQLAAQLGKEAPEVQVDDHGMRLHAQIGGTLRNVFVHLCRNAIDHGIEPALARIAAGKRAAGQIVISAQQVEGRLRIEIVDDGRGLALDRIRERALALGLIDVSAEMPSVALAELVFSPGFSTADQVTEVSGRGVGMDAVRAFLNAEGGDIALVLARDAIPVNGYVPFRTVITLPERFVVPADIGMTEEPIHA
ncbi:ATP-binding protein [Roseateles amylovorans]|uniref:histidine kinase n=1 Tax=Roseateles amylovorans TaxID=2978473 RepID=A0ABY6B1L3_9BURK|nr:ATP-binding protein [Roseateles amylovorans]UXH79072.1 ATP-binding protein [Roseateles amylovorans]